MIPNFEPITEAEYTTAMGSRAPASLKYFPTKGLDIFASEGNYYLYQWRSGTHYRTPINGASHEYIAATITLDKPL
jgi:hypothetical protein